MTLYCVQKKLLIYDILLACETMLSHDLGMQVEPETCVRDEEP